MTETTIIISIILLSFSYLYLSIYTEYNNNKHKQEVEELKRRFEHLENPPSKNTK